MLPTVLLFQVTKDLNSLERKLKNATDEMNSIKMFQQHNTTNFISVIKPVLKAHFPLKYVGKDGAQNLQRDIRHLKIACDGKIPEDKTCENIGMLLRKGKNKVTDAVGDFSDVTHVLKVPSSNPDSTCNSSTAPATSTCNSSTAPATSTSLDNTGLYYQPFLQSPTQFNPQGTGYMPFGMSAPGYQYFMTYPYPGMYSSDAYNQTPRRTWTATCTSAEVDPPLPFDSPPKNPPLPDGDL